MALIEWSDQYSVNIKAIDAQHMELINIMNRLHEAMLQKKSKLIMGDILQQLVDYTYEHFLYEERLLAKYEYPSFDAHKSLHDEMRKKVRELKADHEEGKVILSMKVMNFLKDWVANHILGNDQLYKEFLNSEGIY